MRHPLEKFIRIELLALLLMIIIGLIGLMKKITIFILISLLLIVLSMAFDALIRFQSRDKAEAIKQAIRAMMVLMFTIYLLLAL